MIRHILLAAAVLAGSDAPKPDVLLQRMSDWLGPQRASVRKLDMTVRSGGQVTTWKAAQARGSAGGSRYVLTVLLAPADVRGTAFLAEERDGRPTAQWLWIPSLGRLRRLPLDEFDSFLNTDFTMADMGFIDVHGRKVTLVGSDTLDGKAAYKLQEVPQDRRTFTRIVTWVDRGTAQPIRREYYDVGDKLWLVETFEDVAPIHDVPTAQRVRIEDVQAGSGSEYRVRELAYDIKLSPDVFDPQQLSKAAELPIW